MGSKIEIELEIGTIIKIKLKNFIVKDSKIESQYTDARSFEIYNKENKLLKKYDVECGFPICEETKKGSK